MKKTDRGFKNCYNREFIITEFAIIRVNCTSIQKFRSVLTRLVVCYAGSDDAAPPYIPSQFLGSRREEPAKHPTGIYGNKEKDALSTIDENSVKVSYQFNGSSSIAFPANFVELSFQNVHKRITSKYQYTLIHYF